MSTSGGKGVRVVLLLALLLPALACQVTNRAFEPLQAGATFTPATPALKVARHGLPAPASPTPTPTVTPTASLTPTPTATPTATATFTPTPTIQVTPSSLQLQVFRDIWETIRDNYLYRDYNGLDWDAVYAETLAKVEAGLTPEGFYLAMSEMVFRLGDEHSAYLSPDELAEEQAEFAGENDFVGIGVYSTTVDGKSYVTVIVVFPGSPAEQAGIQSHDNILEVEGLPLIEGDLDRRSTLLGEEGTSVEITVQTPGEAPRQLTLTRRRVQSPLPVPYTLLTSERGRRIGYLMLPTFADETIGRQVGDALQELTEGGRLDGLIIDNRFNNGGINTVTADTLGYFASGVVGYFVNRQGDHGFNVFGRDINGSLDLPLAVLIGPETASFGEIFSGILQDLGRASIVGETTNGNVEILWGFDFDDGSRLWLAHDTFRPLNHPDLDWEQTGIIPDVFAASAWDQYTLENDPVVQAAQNLLEGKKLGE